MEQLSTTENTNRMRVGRVCGVVMGSCCGGVVLEVWEPDTTLSISIRHGFTPERGLNFLAKRNAMYGRRVLFQREEQHIPIPGPWYEGRPTHTTVAAYVFKGFEHGDDL